MRNDNIARSLRYYRNVNHKSIDDIIAFLREHDYDVSEKTIYAWENGSNQPRADILMLLCEYYQIDDVLTAFGYRDAETSFLQDPLSVSEISLIKSYREHKEMQPAVHKLLDLPAPVTRTRRKIQSRSLIHRKKFLHSYSIYGKINIRKRIWRNWQTR